MPRSLLWFYHTGSLPAGTASNAKTSVLRRFALCTTRGQTHRDDHPFALSRPAARAGPDAPGSHASAHAREACGGTKDNCSPCHTGSSQDACVDALARHAERAPRQASQASGCCRCTGRRTPPLPMGGIFGRKACAACWSVRPGCARGLAGAGSVLFASGTALW